MISNRVALALALLTGCLVAAGPEKLFAQNAEIGEIELALAPMTFPESNASAPSETIIPSAPPASAADASDAPADTADDLVVDSGAEGFQVTWDLIEDLRARIVEAESSFDAFNANIGEMSYDLGNQLLKLSQYDEALEAYRRAEHLLRVNHGLYALEQVPALEGMIEANMRMGDWEAVDKDMERLVWLYRRNRSEESEEYLQILNDYAKYHLAAYFWDVDELGLVHLVRAEETLTFIADTAVQRGFGYDPLLYESISIANYTLMSYAASSDNYLDTPELDRRVGLGSYLANSYRRGLDYLRTGREIAYRSGNREHAIQADLILSDWYQLFFKRYEAQEYLRRAWQVASEIGMETSADFTQPHLLPRQGYIGLLPELQGGGERSRILVRLDVDQWGSPRNVELMQDTQQLESDGLGLAASRALRNARQARFRPAIVDGEPVEYTGYVHSVYVEN